MPPIWHYYHAYAAGAWSQPAAEHLTALENAGFPARITVGLVGPPPDRAAFRDTLGGRFAALDPAVRWAETDTGWEQHTLTLLHRDRPAAGAVLYAHTKGASSDGPRNRAWRQLMTRHLIGGWDRCLDLLAAGYDTAGCHWLTPAQFGGCPWYVTTPFYGGNFWWATADYLRRLPPPGTAHRYDAEGWIGLRGPRAADLHPGWPAATLPDR